MALSPKNALQRAGLLVVSSMLFLDVAWGRVMQLRAAARYVSPWRYVNVVFWVVMLAFWGWNAWASWKRMRNAEA